MEPFGQFTSNFSESMIHLLFFYKLLTLCWFQSSFFYPKSFKKCKTRKGFSTQSFVCNMINIGTLLQMKWGCIVLNTCQIHLIVISRAKKLVQGRNISEEWQFMLFYSPFGGSNLNFYDNNFTLSGETNCPVPACESYIACIPGNWNFWESIKFSPWYCNRKWISPGFLKFVICISTLFVSEV